MKGTFKNINKNYLLMEFSPLSWLIISKIMLIILCHARKVLHPQGLSIRKSVHYIRREKSAYFSHKLNKFLILALSHVFPSFFRFFNGFPHPLSLSLSLSWIPWDKKKLRRKNEVFYIYPEMLDKSVFFTFQIFLFLGLRGWGKRCLFVEFRSYFCNFKILSGVSHNFACYSV